MTTQQKKYNEVIDSMELAKREDGTEFYKIRETTEGKTKDVLMDLIYNENIGGIHDLSYEICYRATLEISDIEFKDLIAEDYEGYENEVASVYTSTRLSYLNTNNHDEINDVLTNCSVDISRACAIWYDDMIRLAMSTLIDYIKSDDTDTENN